MKLYVIGLTVKRFVFGFRENLKVISELITYVLRAWWRWNLVELTFGTRLNPTKKKNTSFC